MLRIKSKNIYRRFITLMVLCLWHGLMMSLWTSPAYAQEPPYYVVDAYQTPGVVCRIVNRRPNDFFTRRSGTISSIAVWQGRLYFCSANERRIYQKIEQQEEVIYTHRTYIRDVAFDPNGNLYFSEASGARGNGRIYKIESEQIGDPSARPILYHTVLLRDVGRFWEGDFTFDAQGKLYLSSGNHIPAYIYRVLIVGQHPNGLPRYGLPRRVYKDNKGVIKGIAVAPNIPQDFIYYANWRQTIYRLNISNLRRSVAFSRNIEQSRNPHLSDIAFNITGPE